MHTVLRTHAVKSWSKRASERTEQDETRRGGARSLPCSLFNSSSIRDLHTYAYAPLICQVADRSREACARAFGPNTNCPSSYMETGTGHSEGKKKKKKKMTRHVRVSELSKGQLHVRALARRKAGLPQVLVLQPRNTRRGKVWRAESESEPESESVKRRAQQRCGVCVQVPRCVSECASCMEY
jgi:hypothetical protein